MVQLAAFEASGAMEPLNSVALRAMSQMNATTGFLHPDARVLHDRRIGSKGFVSGGSTLGLERSSRWPSNVVGTIGNLLPLAALNGDGTSAQDSVSRSSHTSTSPPLSIEGRGDELAMLPEFDQDILTEFLDEQLMQILHSPDIQYRQTVLLTDGTDARAYSLSWPNPSLVFHISPQPAYLETSLLFKDLGLKVSKSCLLRHLPLDFAEEEWGDEDLIKQLTERGYKGDNPSVWVLQISQTLPKDFFRRILEVGSRLLMKGSKFLGVVPYPSSDFSETEAKMIVSDLFLGQGFTVRLYSYNSLALERGLESSSVLAGSNPFVFIAQQERLSDLQVEGGLKEMELAEEVDEDGFEDSW